MKDSLVLTCQARPLCDKGLIFFPGHAGFAGISGPIKMSLHSWLYRSVSSPVYTGVLIRIQPDSLRPTNLDLIRIA